MHRVPVAVGVVACFCLVLAWLMSWGRTALSEWRPRPSRDQLRRVGWVAGLLAMAASVIMIAGGGNPDQPGYLAAAATALIIFCAPPQARRLMPLAALVIGLAGLALALYSNSSPYGGFLLNGMSARATAWRASLMLQSGVFLAAGLWLIWRGRQSGRARAVNGEGEGGMGSWTGGRWRWRWGVMLPPAAAIAVLLVDQAPGHAVWKAAAAAAVVALIMVLLLPAAAPDFAAAGVVALGLCALSYVVSPPVISYSASPFVRSAQPVPASGSLHGVISPVSQGLPHGLMYAGADGPLDLVAGIQAAAILALGIWLVPRTIGVHARTLLRTAPDAELVGRVEQLTQTRAEAVDTAAAELRRVERDLHDGAQARLVALGMNLRAAERLIPTSPEAAIALVAEAREASSRALTELRDLVRGVYPPVLADRGLADAVRALALDTPIRTETDIDVPGRLDPPVESACYFAVAEALTNAVKHSGARVVQIRMRYSAGYPARPFSPAHPFRSAHFFQPAQPARGLLRIEVTDDGTGGADPARGSGLQGVERRLGTFDGILAVSSPPGGPTIIVMEIPCALSSRRTSSC